MSLSAPTPFNPTYPTKAGQHHRWGQLYGSSLSLAVSRLTQQHQAAVVLITADSLSAQRLTEDLRFYAGADLPLLNFPDWETLPYDVFSPHQDIVSERLATLYQLPSVQRGVLILPVTTLMQRLPPQAYVQANSLIVKKGQHLTRDALCRRLESSGYRRVNQVVEHGEFSVRGSLLDLFPMGSQHPFRLDFFDDDIDSLRRFDPETQRSRAEVPEIWLLPAREFPLDKTAQAQFREQWCSRFPGDPNRCPVYRDITHGLATPGVEYYLPLFFSPANPPETHSTQTLFDYLPAGSLLVATEQFTAVAERFWDEISERYEQLRHDIERPLLPPSELFLPVDALFRHLKAYPQIFYRHDIQDDTEALTPASAAAKGIYNFATRLPPTLPIDARAADPLSHLKHFLQQFDGRVLIAAETTGRRETLLELLQRHQLQPRLFDSWQAFLDSDARLGVSVAALEQGALLDNPALAVISETQLFGERVAQRRRRQSGAARDPDAVVRNLTELSIGAAVVHEDHGVGRYLGLVALEVGGITTEFLQLEYAGGDKLYVPIMALGLISRFTGVDPEHAPLHKLGNPHWLKAKAKAAEQVRDVAAELLELHARRAARPGHAFAHDPDAYQAFVQGFPFEETPDQQAAIDAVLNDMHAPRAMDRLVCGDVGFGKTEVAMRAAFIAAQDGKQVAVLVPTTLLAQQHYQNFCDRFADWPVKIEQLSRFRSSKQQAAALQELADGKIDIVIGTHKLLQAGIHFKRLGLVIIDEEHRFGVRQKERFKSLRAEVDILTLTATPIPRSLNMALADLRDLSIIATPPSKRLAIKTFVQEWRKPVLAEAIQRELRRGGQVYFLHNEVESIEKIAQEVLTLAPEARIEIAHGQMPERELERVMRDFYHRRFNVLVCTTIIETGIDVPSANTIIINRADKFGLAQLYQLRGRVGRSHHRAYAYLITPPKKSMTTDAIKRLDALSALEELGVGFTLATHDLEIRGAGELLGDDQSGHMQEIGYGLYTELLERAVQSLKAGQQPALDRPLDHGTEIDLRSSALLPDSYLPDVHHRLILYKRIASALNQDELDEIRVELIDRFGLLPLPAKQLFQVTGLKLKANPLGVRKIELGEQGGRIQFIAKPPLDPLRVLQLVREQPRLFKLDAADNTLRIQRELPDFEARAGLLNQVLDYLSAHS